MPFEETADAGVASRDRPEACPPLSIGAVRRGRDHRIARCVAYAWGVVEGSLRPSHRHRRQRFTSRPRGPEVSCRRERRGDAAELLLGDNVETLEGVGVPPARELLAKLRDHAVPVYV